MAWFVVRDAFGEVFDDYAPEHPMTQAQDAAERARRMKWISETFGAVVGSEGGSAYAAPVVHFAHISAPSCAVSHESGVPGACMLWYESYGPSP